MRRTLRIALVVGVVLAVLRRRRRAVAEAGTVTIGYADGSSTTLDAGSPERELILATAAEALA